MSRSCSSASSKPSASPCPASRRGCSAFSFRSWASITAWLPASAPEKPGFGYALAGTREGTPKPTEEEVLRGSHRPAGDRTGNRYQGQGLQRHLVHGAVPEQRAEARDLREGRRARGRQRSRRVLPARPADEPEGRRAGQGTAEGPPRFLGRVLLSPYRQGLAAASKQGRSPPCPRLRDREPPQPSAYGWPPA